MSVLCSSSVCIQRITQVLQLNLIVCDLSIKSPLTGVLPKRSSCLRALLFVNRQISRRRILHEFTPVRMRQTRGYLGAAALLLLIIPASAQCVNFTMPPMWPDWAPQPPYSVVSAKLGGTIDCVFLNNLTLGNSSTTMGGKLGTVCGGAFISPIFATCSNSSARIVGFGYKVALTYPYGSYSGLHTVGPFVSTHLDAWSIGTSVASFLMLLFDAPLFHHSFLFQACSDGSTNGTVYAGTGTFNTSSVYTLPDNLCGWPPHSATPTPSVSTSFTSSYTAAPSYPSCVSFTPPSIWPNMTTMSPPYTRIAARGGGTLDAVILYNATASQVIGGAGGSLLYPSFAACAPSTSIVGFAYSYESTPAYAPPFAPGAYSGLRSIGPFGEIARRRRSCASILRALRFMTLAAVRWTYPPPPPIHPSPLHADSM